MLNGIFFRAFIALIAVDLHCHVIYYELTVVIYDANLHLVALDIESSYIDESNFDHVIEL